jgi:predicted glycosyltransferase involved in capsule biosynthesis
MKGIIVVDNKYMPECNPPHPFTVVRYPGDLQVFNLSKCKNYGIRHTGGDMILSTDIDCLLTDELIQRIQKLKQSEFVVPLYYRVPSWDAHKYMMGTPVQRMMGTIASHYDNWQAIHGYDERFTGYGADDAVPINAFKHLGMRGDCHRIPVFHVDHDEEPRDIFNPLNRESNREFLKNSIDEWAHHSRSLNWGKVL